MTCCLYRKAGQLNGRCLLVWKKSIPTLWNVENSRNWFGREGMVEQILWWNRVPATDGLSINLSLHNKYFPLFFIISHTSVLCTDRRCHMLRSFTRPYYQSPLLLLLLQCMWLKEATPFLCRRSSSVIAVSLKDLKSGFFLYLYSQLSPSSRCLSLPLLKIIFSTFHIYKVFLHKSSSS